MILEPLDFTGVTHERLQRAGCEIVLGRAMWDKPDRRYTEAEMVDLCRGARAVMGASRERYGREFLEAMPSLVVLSKYGIGTERIDVASATQLGILVTHTPVDENVFAVAEHSVTLMLSLLRRLKPMEKVLREGGWRGPATVVDDLRGKVVGIVGFGRIGRQVRRLLGPWGAEFVAFDPYCDPEAASEAGVKLLSLRDLLEQADVVTVHVTATAQSRGMIGREQLAWMKPTARLVNTSRGDVLDEEALFEALSAGRLAGAALDVFQKEPPDATHPLFSLPNVIATPHVAGFSREVLLAIAAAGAENVLAALRGEVPRYVKNPEVLPQWRGRRPNDKGETRDD